MASVRVFLVGAIVVAVLPLRLGAQAADASSNKGLVTPYPDTPAGNWPHPPRTDHVEPNIAKTPPAPSAALANTVSVVSLKAPDKALAAYHRGLEEAHKNNFTQAQKKLEQAVQIYPQFADAWCALGEVHEMQNHLPEGRAAYLRSLAADPKLIFPYLHLASLEADAKQWPQVAQFSERALHLNPNDFPSAWYYSALANFKLGHNEVAEVRARKAEAMDTHHLYPKVYLLLADLLVAKEDFAGAAQQTRTYLQLAPDSANRKGLVSYLQELDRLAAGAAHP